MEVCDNGLRKDLLYVMTTSLAVPNVNLETCRLVPRLSWDLRCTFCPELKKNVYGDNIQVFFEIAGYKKVYDLDSDMVLNYTSATHSWFDGCG